MGSSLDDALANAPASFRARLAADQLRSQPVDKARGSIERAIQNDLQALSDHGEASPVGWTSRALHEWTMKDPEKARAWLDGIEEPVLHAALGGTAAAAVRERDGLTAAVAMLSALPADEQAPGCSRSSKTGRGPMPRRRRPGRALSITLRVGTHASPPSQPSRAGPTRSGPSPSHPASRMPPHESRCRTAFSRIRKHGPPRCSKNGAPAIPGTRTRPITLTRRRRNQKEGKE
jgi:hypothetical protein